MNPLTLQFGQQRAAELRREAAQEARARQVQPERPQHTHPGVRALLARLRLRPA